MAKFALKSRLPWRFALAIAGGLLAGPTLPQANLWILIFPSMALLLLSVKGVKFWRGFGIGLVGGITFYASQTTWLTAYLGPIPWLALATLMGIIFAFGLGSTARIWFWLESNQRRLGIWYAPAATLILAATWVAREWVACNFPYGGFQWSRLAQSQADTFLAKWAYWGGLTGVSFAVAVLVAGAIVWITGSRNWNAPLAALLAVTLLIPLITQIPATSSSGSFTVGAVQGNANAGLFANPVPGSILVKHMRETRMMMKDGKADSIQMVVWPENASDLDPLNYPPARAAVVKLVDETIGVPLILGAVTHRGEAIYNSTIQFDPQVGPVDFYDKQHPVPFAEYVPDRPFWYSLAPDLVGLIHKGFSFGTREGTFEVGKTTVGSLICFEIANDHTLLDLVNGGSQLILSQANNSDFGHTDETFQQGQLVKLQAIASGRTIVHVSTVGVTQVVTPDGQVANQIPAFKPGYIIAKVPLMNQVTPAMRTLGALDYLSVLGTLVLLAFSLQAGRLFLPKSKRRHPTKGKTN